MATLVSNVGNLVSEMLNPVGTVIQGPITSAPTGYLLCNGQAVERTKYSKLFDVIGTNFGSGDGSTTFNIPDYRGCFLRMLSTDTAQNTNMYAKQGSGIPNITGRFSGGELARPDVGISTSGAIYSNNVSSGYRPIGEGGQNASLEFNASRSSSVYQNDLTEARPVNYAVNYFIKY